MTAAIMERERIAKYTEDEFRSVFENEGLSVADDVFYVSAISMPTAVFEVQGVATPMAMPSKSLRMYFTDHSPTGYFQKLGGERILLVNTEDYTDYTLISDLHTVPDADVYLGLTEPYEAGRDVEFEVTREWYRDETFLDHFAADENEKGGTR